jgi:hypothetical protein
MPEMNEAKFENMLKSEGMPEVVGAPRFAGHDLAKRIMEICVFCDGQKP